MFEEWMLTGAYDVTAFLPVKPREALADLRKPRFSGNAGAKRVDVNCLLPPEQNEALAVLALAKQIVLKINKPYVTHLRAAAQRGRRSSAVRKRKKPDRH